MKKKLIKENPLMDEFSDEIKKAIMSSAKKVLSRASHEDVSIHDVAKDAGIAVGTVYNYFKDLDALKSAVNVSTRKDEGVTYLVSIKELRSIIKEDAKVMKFSSTHAATAATPEAKKSTILQTLSSYTIGEINKQELFATLNAIDVDDQMRIDLYKLAIDQEKNFQLMKNCEERLQSILRTIK